MAAWHDVERAELLPVVVRVGVLILLPGLDRPGLRCRAAVVTRSLWQLMA